GRGGEKGAASECASGTRVGHGVSDQADGESSIAAPIRGTLVHFFSAAAQLSTTVRGTGAVTPSDVTRSTRCPSAATSYAELRRTDATSRRTPGNRLTAPTSRVDPALLTAATMRLWSGATKKISFPSRLHRGRRPPDVETRTFRPRTGNDWI